MPALLPITQLRHASHTATATEEGFDHVSTIRNTSPSPAASYASLVPQGGQSLQPVADLQLTAQQRTRIRSFFQSSNRNAESSKQLQKQMSSVLTAEQKQTLTARGCDRSHQLSKLLGLPNDEAAAGSSDFSRE